MGKVSAIPGAEAGQQVHPADGAGGRLVRREVCGGFVAGDVLVQGGGEGGGGGGKVHPADEVLFGRGQGPDGGCTGQGG